MSKYDRYVLVSDFTANSGVGIQSRLWVSQLSDISYRVLVLCCKSDPINVKNAKVMELAPRLPYSFRVLLITTLALFLNVFHKKLDSFEIFAFRYLTFHLHSNCFDSSKLDGLPYFRRKIRNFVTNLQKLAVQRANKLHGQIIVPSKSLIEKIRENQHVQSIYDLPNALDPEDPVVQLSVPPRLKLEKVDSIDKRILRIGFIAQGDIVYKGLREAVKLLCGLNMRIVIEVAGMSRPSEVDENLDSYIVWKGNMRRDEYSVWLLGMDGIVVGSKYESFSMAAYEAIILGKPVLSLGKIGVAEYYSGNLLFDSNSQLEQFVYQIQKTHKSDLSNDFFLKARLVKMQRILGDENYKD